MKVLLGWVASEITLGLFFMFVKNESLFIILLTPCTALFAIGAAFLTNETKVFAASR